MMKLNCFMVTLVMICQSDECDEMSASRSVGDYAKKNEMIPGFFSDFFLQYTLY